MTAELITEEALWLLKCAELLQHQLEIFASPVRSTLGTPRVRHHCTWHVSGVTWRAWRSFWRKARLALTSKIAAERRPYTTPPSTTLLRSSRCDSAEARWQLEFYCIIHPSRRSRLFQVLCSRLCSGVNELNTNGETPLHVACRTGRVESVKALLGGGAKCDVLGGTGYPIHSAMKYSEKGWVVERTEKYNMSFIFKNFAFVS